MELEALLLGVEPLTALAVGIGAIILVPVVEAVGSAVGLDYNQLGESVSKSVRETTKNGLVWGFEVFDNAQSAFAEAEESVRDLWAEAKADHTIKKSQSERVEPRPVEVVAE